jgi:hypothetical protein
MFAMTPFFDFTHWVAPATGIAAAFLSLFVCQVFTRGRGSSTGVPLLGGAGKCTRPQGRQGTITFSYLESDVEERWR